MWTQSRTGGGNLKGIVHGPEKHFFRETSPRNNSAFAVNCKHSYQQCPDSLNIWIWLAFLLGMKTKVPFAGVLTALGAAWMRGRRLLARCCLCLAAASPPPLQWADDASPVLYICPHWILAVPEPSEGCRVEPSQNRVEENLKPHTSFQ